MIGTSYGSTVMIFSADRKREAGRLPEADASVIIKRVACQLFIIKKEKGKESMKIAVTYDNGEVFSAFWKNREF